MRWIFAFMVGFSLSLANAGGAAALPRFGETVSGIRCDRTEGTVFHIHQHLVINDHGKPVAIPGDVGRPILAGCLYWLHTHTPDGIIHIESPAIRTFTLGQFFQIWGQPLTKTQVASAKLRPGEKTTVWVNGTRRSGDPAKIELTQHSDIVIDVGAPAPKPAPFTGWATL